MDNILNKFLAKLLQSQTIFNSKHSVFVCGLLSIGLYFYLSLQSRDFADASFNDLAVVVFPCAFLSFFAWYHLHLDSTNAKQNKANTGKEVLYLIILFAIIFRLIGFMTFPVLEDDFYRYLWDGYVFVEYGNPYLAAPSSYFSSDLVSDNFQDILSSINYPDIATVYGPLCQWVFALAYVIAPGELWPLKIILLICDLILLFTVYKLMQAFSVKIHYLILLAWSPLVITQFVVAMHPDIIAVMFVFLALLAFQKNSNYIACLCLALAVAAKIFAVILVPILLGFYWRRWLVFALICVVIAVPFGLVQAWFPEGLKAMAQQWYFNAPLYELFSIMDFSQLKMLLLLSFSVIYCLGWYKQWWHKANTVLRGDLIFAAFFLVLPALNSWYFIFLIPFGVFYATRTLWLASVMIFLSYIFIQENNYQYAGLIYIFEFGLLSITLLFDITNQKSATISKPKLRH